MIILQRKEKRQKEMGFTFIILSYLWLLSLGPKTSVSVSIGKVQIAKLISLLKQYYRSKTSFFSFSSMNQPVMVELDRGNYPT